MSLIVGVQSAMLVCVPVVVVTTIVVSVANQGDAYLRWAIFASLIIGGLLTVVQSKRIGGLGGGTLTVMGMSGASIGVGVVALVVGGPPLLAALVLAAGLFQLLLAARLVLLRRIITPVVAGTLTALVAVTVMPRAFEMLTRLPDTAPPAAAPTITVVTMLCVLGVLLRGHPLLRAWSAVIGIGTGCVTAALFGILDFGRVAAAPWIGIPPATSLGLDVSFDARFWLLLPGFLFLSLVIAIRQVTDAVQMQRLSEREPKATDFRRVQGSVAAGGVGTLLSGLAGVLPPWSYLTGIALASGVGIAARRVGVYIGTTIVALAFMPKITAIVLSIPPPILGAYISVVFGIAFTQGLRVLFREGIDREYALIAGFAFWIGAGIQFQAIFPAYLATPAGQLLANGLTAGGLCLLLLHLFMDLSGPRRHRIEVALRPGSLPELDRFLKDFASRYKWSGVATDRLRAACEEALQSLLRSEREAHVPATGERRLRLVARNTRQGARLEFTAARHAGNLENQLTLLGDRPDPGSERDLSLALLRHYASSVRHHQYHNVDVLTVRVNPR